MPKLRCFIEDLGAAFPGLLGFFAMVFLSASSQPSGRAHEVSRPVNDVVYVQHE